MRYLPLADADRAQMLAAIGAGSIEDLFVDVPESARLAGKIAGLPDHASEMAVERKLSAMARRNLVAGDAPFFLGCGAYRHHIPASVDHLIQRGEFLTSYTPYQPEIAQGTLQALFEFQTQVARLFGCDVANASMYDGSTACWEAIGMARRITRRTKALLSSGLHPHYVAVAQTMAKFTGDLLVHGAPRMEAASDVDAIEVDGETSCVVVQYPDILGRIAGLSGLAAKCQAAGALLIAGGTEPVALGAIRSPGEMGADIVVGEGQSIGVGLNFGGPYVGLFATRDKYVRQMPGRLPGETVDAQGKRGFVLTLSTREQHIRREKATSNICTNSGLCALAFTIHMTLLGEAGLRRLARVNHANAVALAQMLGAIPGVEVLNTAFFNEFTIRLPGKAAEIVEKLAAKGVLGGVPYARLKPDSPDLRDLVIVASTEVNTDDDRRAYAKALEEVLA